MGKPGHTHTFSSAPTLETVMADSKTKKEKLLIALRKGEAAKVATLLDGFPEEVQPDMAADTADNRLLHRAARFGHSSVVTVLLDRGAQPNMTNKFGMTPLHHGAVEGCSQVLSALIKGGGDPNTPDQSGRLPLHWVATKGHVEGTRALLDGGAKATMPDMDGFTPLHRCGQEEPPPVKKQEEEEEVDRNAVDKAKAEIAGMLIKKGADIHARDMRGQQTTLHLAAMNGLVEVVKVLITHGAEINSTNKIGQTPLIYAVIEEKPEVIKALLEAGADVNKGNGLHWGWRPLHWAALTDNIDILEVLLTREDIKNVKDDTGTYPHALAEQHGKRKVLELLRGMAED